MVSLSAARARAAASTVTSSPALRSTVARSVRRSAFTIRGAQAGLTDVSASFMSTGKPDVAVGAILGWQRVKIRPRYPDPLSSSTGYLDVVLRVYWL